MKVYTSIQQLGNTIFSGYSLYGDNNQEYFTKVSKLHTKSKPLAYLNALQGALIWVQNNNPMNCSKTVEYYPENLIHDNLTKHFTGYNFIHPVYNEEDKERIQYLKTVIGREVHSFAIQQNIREI